MTVQRDTLFPSFDDAKQTAAPRYASVFWLTESLASGDGARVVIGWSVSLDSATNHEFGAWGFEVRTDSAVSLRARQLPFVEESAGVLYVDASAKTQELNDRVERLIADHLLVFTHRVLFGQGTIPNIPSVFQPVDCLLIHGPRLPKLVGRLCYSHLHRNKLIAILAPRRIFGSPPRMSTGAWPAPNSHPDPPFYDDSAVRRWEAPSSSTRPDQEARIAGFDLVIPVGDGLTGNSVEGDVGQRLWQNKASIVERLLDSDFEQLRVAVWQNLLVRVPAGMCGAIKAAIIQMMSRRGEEMWQLKQQLITALPKVTQENWQAVEQHLRKQPRIPKELKALAFCAGIDDLQRHERLWGGERKAARHVSAKELAEIAAHVGTILKNQLGDSVYPNA